MNEFSIGDKIKIIDINKNGVISDYLGYKTAKEWELTCGRLNKNEKKKFPAHVYRLKNEDVPFAHFELKKGF